MLRDISDGAWSRPTTRLDPLIFLCAWRPEACAILPNKPDYVQKIFALPTGAWGSSRIPAASEHSRVLAGAPLLPSRNGAGFRCSERHCSVEFRTFLAAPTISSPPAC